MSVTGRRRLSHRTIAIVRDIVEVAAILAAGAWAIYTFVYEQRIKPASEPPSIVLTGALQHLGERAGLVQIGYHATLRNIGHTRIYIIQLGVAGIAQRYTRVDAPIVTHPFPNVTQYDRNSRIGSYTPIYRMQELTRYADPKYKSGFELDPGEEIPYSGVFLVPKRDFDAVTIFGSVAFSRSAGVYPTKITYFPNGAIVFTGANGTHNYNDLEVTLDRTTLW